MTLTALAALVAIGTSLATWSPEDLIIKMPIPHDLMFAAFGPKYLRQTNEILDKFRTLPVSAQRLALTNFLEKCVAALKSDPTSSLGPGLDAGKIDMLAIARGATPVGYPTQLFFLSRRHGGALDYSATFRPITSIAGQPFGPSFIVSIPIIRKMESAVSEGHYDLHPRGAVGRDPEGDGPSR